MTGVGCLTEVMSNGRPAKDILKSLIPAGTGPLGLLTPLTSTSWSHEAEGVVVET